MSTQPSRKSAPHCRRSGAVLALVLAIVAAVPATAQEDIDPGYLHVKALLSEKRSERRSASRALVERGDVSLAFGIVDALFFIPKRLRRDAFDTLEELTGAEDVERSYWAWVEQMGRLGETTRPAPGYPQWKTILLSKIDERYRQVFYPGAPACIRLEEVVTGGVRLDGIPSLDDPPMIAADEAEYLRGDEAVFGVFLNGEARAYPLRILDWHEMLNDVVGGVPVTLSYCTLCGSGVLFKTETPNGGAYRFGTSGLLYRSNKLMYDRGSLTLWSNLTGEPVIGRLARGDRELEILPMTRTSWGEWKARHPQTKVVEIDEELEQIASDHGFDYRPGRADAARRGVAFPVWKRSQALPQDAEIYVLRLEGGGSTAEVDDRTHVKAYPLEELLAVPGGVLNDSVGGEDVVLLVDEDAGAVRAYRRGPDIAKRDGDLLIAADGTRWRAGELALEPVDAESSEPTPTPLERLPGHHAYWFGWYAFFPQTEVWQGRAATEP